MSQSLVEQMNSTPGRVKEIGAVFLAASLDEVTCECEVGESKPLGKS